MKRIFIAACACLIVISCNSKTESESKTAGATDSTGSASKKAPVELLDPSNTESVKQAFAAFANKDVDGMAANYADDIKFNFSGGDSLRGKQAVVDYFKGRWNYIESLKFSDEIALPLQVNESQNPQVAPPGKYVLYWHKGDVVYKNGKNLTFWIHSVNHFNDAGKVDFIAHYLDYKPIAEATKDLMK